ncbi:MAG TPA: L,D-transpeptidase family protein [Thermoanaerobaculia bacterium]|nr:L,D-transpeptidase family protein [Thermoanaerobaculia bacterium]
MRQLALLFALAITCLVAPLHGDETSDAIRGLLEADTWSSLSIGGQHIHDPGDLVAVYQDRDYAPVWVSDPARLRALLGVLDGAESHGLRRGDYHYKSIAERAGLSLTGSAAAELELLASDAFLTYALHLGRGKVTEERIADWNIDRPDVDLRARLVRAAKGDPAASIADLLPRNPGYDRLREALERYRSIAGEGGWKPLSGGASLRASDHGAGGAALRKRLGITGDLAPDAGNAFDDSLDAAVRRFQSRNGLDPDGVVGPATRAALNVPVAKRIEQITINLERWRWLKADLGERYVLVNIAGFNAGLYDDDRLTLGMRAIVGKPYRRTPIFSDDIRYIVFSPYWNIPSSIAHDEILPKGTDYMRQHDIEVLPSGRLRQLPGPENALGRVKFMFPNRFSVYLHDTPARELFKQTSRSFSHGCIRLAKPLQLAEELLRNQGWTMEKVESAVERSSPLTVNLEKSVPVHILYWTAWVDESGTVQFRHDVYGRDGAVSRALRERPDGKGE